MSYQISPGDPIVTFDSTAFERLVATKLKSAGIANAAQLLTAITGVTTTSCPGMSSVACQLLQALGQIIVLS